MQWVLKITIAHGFRAEPIRCWFLLGYGPICLEHAEHTWILKVRGFQVPGILSWISLILGWWMIQNRQWIKIADNQERKESSPVLDRSTGERERDTKENWTLELEMHRQWRHGPWNQREGEHGERKSFQTMGPPKISVHIRLLRMYVHSTMASRNALGWLGKYEPVMILGRGLSFQGFWWSNSWNQINFAF